MRRIRYFLISTVVVALCSVGAAAQADSYNLSISSPGRVYFEYGTGYGHYGHDRRRHHYKPYYGDHRSHGYYRHHGYYPRYRNERRHGYYRPWGVHPRRDYYWHKKHQFRRHDYGYGYGHGMSIHRQHRD